MSYRDLRNFSEAMRALGFPRPISMDSFRTPNFPLVEEALRWLAARAAEEELPGGGSGGGSGGGGGGGGSEQRVQLVAHAVQLFLSRLNIKLSGRKLYGADGWAVRELLKVAAVLRAALAAPAAEDAAGDAPSYDVSAQLGDIKQARRLATEITARGALLYDLLAKEPEYKEARTLALSRPMDLSSMEATLQRALTTAAARAAATRDQTERAAAAEAAMDAKLERRRAELQRAEKRLHTVQKIKPAYQAELVELEREVSRLWQAHVLRFRCVAALRHQLSLLEAARAEAAEEQQAAIMQLIHKYEAEDVLGKLSDSDEVDDSSDETKAEEASEGRSRPRSRPRPASRPRTRLRIKTAAVPAEPRRAFGSMAAPDELDDDTDLSDDEAFAVVDESSSSGRWGGARARPPRAPRPPRPATRALLPDDVEFADLIEGVETAASDSLGSSSESELRLVSAAPPRASAAPPRASAAPPRASVAPHPAPAPLSDNEF